ncbi:MAG: LysR family transcriptional regulator [Anaerolineae bacterium]|nr:LysR family transcriptional regulator [Anaerolineae bacterium]
MDSQDLRYFVAVAQTLNITKAAEQLFITRQALSKAILEFEKKCGSELFLRNNGKLQLTARGRELLEKSIPIVDLFNDLEKSVNASSRSQKSKIRIAIGLGTLNALSPQVFAHFKSDHPEIELSVKEVCDDEVRKYLETEEADIGILNSTPEKIKNYDYRLVQDGKICLQISKKDPLSAKDLITPEDMHLQPLVSLGERCDMHSVLMEKCHQVNSFPNLVLETIDSNVANNMVYDNMAISLFIQSKTQAASPAVRIIPLALGDTPWGTYVISRKGFDHTHSTRLLIDYLENCAC